ncbi:38958_t:CDS:2, partial [Gigaspora margarita]
NLHNSDPNNDIDLADKDSDNELTLTQNRKHVTIREYTAYCLYLCSPINGILHHQRGKSTKPEDLLIVSHVLSEIKDHFRQCGKYLIDFPDLSIIQHNLLNTNKQTQLFAEEMTFLQDEL